MQCMHPNFLMTGQVCPMLMSSVPQAWGTFDRTSTLFKLVVEFFLKSVVFMFWQDIVYTELLYCVTKFELVWAWIVVENAKKRLLYPTPTFYIKDSWVTSACPEKLSVPWIHCIEYIFFIIQEFWATCACPESFEAGGKKTPPPARLVRLWGQVSSVSDGGSCFMGKDVAMVFARPTGNPKSIHPWQCLSYHHDQDDVGVYGSKLNSRMVLFSGMRHSTWCMCPPPHDCMEAKSFRLLVLEAVAARMEAMRNCSTSYFHRKIRF